jgi:cytidine deaminase
MTARPTVAARDRALLRAARQVQRRAHAPYSHFEVGAAVRTRGGRIFAGCNVENASFGASICAERSAILQAVAAGMRPGDLQAVAVFTDDPRLTPPCGMCLQVLVEFGREVEVFLSAPGRVRRTALAALVPEPFRDFATRPRTRRR